MEESITRHLNAIMKAWTARNAFIKFPTAWKWRYYITTTMKITVPTRIITLSA